MTTSVKTSWSFTDHLTFWYSNNLKKNAYYAIIIIIEGEPIIKAGFFTYVKYTFWISTQIENLGNIFSLHCCLDT